VDTTFLETTHTPRVSIGMPVYNGEPYMREALDALLAQTFTDFELIISDNASTDRTEEICREYAAKDRRIRYVRQKTNRGATANFQYVLDEAVGEYFMWAAHDDWWDPLFIEVCMSILQKNEKLSFAFTRYRCESRLSSLFNMKFKDILSLIEIKNTEERVYQYSSKSFWTHKDNLVYSFWRREFILMIMALSSKLYNGKIIIGTVMNELVLVKGYGGYSKKLLFCKKYKYLPPGSWAQPLFNIVALFYFIVKGKHKKLQIEKKEYIKKSIIEKKELLKNIEILLKSEKFDSKFIEKILNANLLHLKL
jgi:glycosyltransferase involved in cell wall biosynthesis